MKFLMLFVVFVFLSSAAYAEDLAGRWKMDDGTVYNFKNNQMTVEGGPPGLIMPYTFSSDGKLSYTVMGQTVEAKVLFQSPTQIIMTDVESGKGGKLTKLSN